MVWRSIYFYAHLFNGFDCDFVPYLTLPLHSLPCGFRT